MAIYLDHTIVPAHEKEKSAKFLARMMGLEYGGLFGPFAAVKVNDTLSLDFADRENFEHQHFAFLVTDEDFDAILGRVKAEGLKYGSSPGTTDDMQINHRHQGRGFYFRDENNHSWEFITHTYIREEMTGGAGRLETTSGSRAS
jgi:catechol 2,3-dioxygenase-like lactoylglutathione lyase family enzyme